MYNQNMRNKIQKEKAFWQKYTDENISDEDILEINQNLQNFARVLLKIQKNLKNKKEEIDDR